MACISKPKRLLWAATGAMLLAGSAMAQQLARRGAEDPEHPCGMVYTEHYGPYDYRTQRGELKIVEDFHFTQRVERLQGGQSGYIGGDLNYTLKAGPNHHRALVALMRWVEKNKSEKTDGMGYTAECYFDRAIRYRPDDTVVRALYAEFLHKRKRNADGIKQLDVGVFYAGESAFSHYNLGLVYLELGAHDKALRQAQRAMALGFPRTGLKDELVKLGKWQEPAAAQSIAAAAPASAAASAAQ